MSVCMDVMVLWCVYGFLLLGERLHGVTGRATHALWTMQSMHTRVVIELLFFRCLFVCAFCLSRCGHAS